MLAIIIPYYKIIFFEATLQSLANQTNKQFKVYIGDDASNENPNDLLENYKGKFRFAYHRFEENIGGASLTKQWERCVELSIDEEWIMILGDDDVLSENVVEEFYKQLPFFKDKSNVVRFSTEVINSKNEIISKKYDHPVWEKASDSFFRKLVEKTRISLSEHIFLKESFLKHKFYNYPLGWNSDDHAWFNFTDNKPIYAINNSLIYIRVSDHSISGKNDNENEKRQSVIQFLKYVITKKFSLFNVDQQLVLLLNFEVFIKNKRKLSLKEWLLVIFNYIKIFKLFPFLKVCKRFVISIFKY